MAVSHRKASDGKPLPRNDKSIPGLDGQQIAAKGDLWSTIYHEVIPTEAAWLTERSEADDTMQCHTEKFTAACKRVRIVSAFPIRFRRNLPSSPRTTLGHDYFLSRADGVCGSRRKRESASPRF
jgi:hypothetical protein